MPITDFARDNAARLGLRVNRLEVLENLIQKIMADDERQALVIHIAKNGFPVFEGCYGTNTKPYGVKKDLIFPVASISKPVVSALLLMLQEDGLVDLNEPVSEYLPEFKGGGREDICLWHFLTHTSGLMDEDIWPFVSDYIKTEFGLLQPGEGSTPEDWDAFERNVREKMGLDPDAPQNDRLNDASYIISLKQPIKHKPRSHMTYCNYGYQKLKEVIDAVTGEPIDAFAGRKLFQPLRMPDTYWNVPEDKWDRILGRLEICEGTPWINTKYNYQNESGSGGMKSTVGDITNFCRMILDGGIFEGERYLSRHSVTEMIRDHNDGVLSGGNRQWGAWGLGWNIRLEKKDDTGMLRSRNSFCHGGWAGTKIMSDPDENVTAAIFTAEYRENVKPRHNVYGRILNAFYSALE